MSVDLPPYPAIKDSAVAWLGEVPDHWTAERLKSSMHNIVEQTTERRAADLYVALEHVESWTGRLRHAGLDVSFDSQVKCFRSGDVLFGKLRPYLAKVTRPTSDGICVGEFLVLRPRHSNATAPYMEQLLRSKPIIDAVNSSTFGAKMPRADWQFMGGMAIALPPLPEQAAIVRFLDHADRRIRRYIRAQQQLVMLLEEQKQAIIHQAITGQIDVRTGRPFPAYKPSGVPWLGDVPEHWEIAQLGRLIDLLTGFPFKSEGFTQDADDIRLLRGANIAPGKVRWNDIVRWPIRDRPSYLSFELHAGDIVLGMDRPIIQSGVRVATIEESDLPSLLLQRVACIRPEGRLRADFLILLLAGKSFSAYLAPIFTGISVPHLSPEQIRLFRFALPAVMEQEKIVEWTVASTKTVESAVKRTHREIALLGEYRTRLIADVVTGKFDVREAAARLPDEVEELEPLDEADTLIDGEDEPTDALATAP